LGLANYCLPYECDTPSDGEGGNDGECDDEGGNDGEGNDREGNAGERGNDGEGNDREGNAGERGNDGEGNDEESYTCFKLYYCIIDCAGNQVCADSCFASSSEAGVGFFDALFLQCIPDNESVCINEDGFIDVDACFAPGAPCESEYYACSNDLLPRSMADSSYSPSLSHHDEASHPERRDSLPNSQDFDKVSSINGIPNDYLSDITREVPRNWPHSPVPLPPHYDRINSNEEQLYGDDAGDLPEHLRRELSDDRGVDE
jgi:hypothetical protein